MKKRLLSIICAIAVLFSGSSRSTYAYETQRIPIAMALDNNFVFPTIVAVTSMLENANNNTFYKYYLMMSGELTSENIKKILTLKQKYINRCDFEFIDMRDEYKTSRTLSYVTAPTYYRLRIPDIINEKKCLYLDGDIIVNEDLQELFKEDIESFYIAGVLSSSTCFVRKGYAQKLQVPDMKRYINAGVLLMNLDEMRANSMGTRFEKFLPLLRSRRLTLYDQDVINSCCYSGIKVIPFKYNTLNQYPLLDDTAYE